MTFPKHIWGRGVTFPMGLVIKRNVHSNPRASRTDDFHRGFSSFELGTAQVIYCIHIHMYDIYKYIYIFDYIYIAFPPWITCESHTENTALYQQKSNNIMETLNALLQRLVAWFSTLSGASQPFFAFAAHQRGGHHPGFSDPKKLRRFVGGSGSLQDEFPEEIWVIYHGTMIIGARVYTCTIMYINIYVFTCVYIFTLYLYICLYYIYIYTC